MDVDETTDQDYVEIDQPERPSFALQETNDAYAYHTPHATRPRTMSDDSTPQFLSHVPQLFNLPRATDDSFTTAQEGNLSPRQQVEAQSRPLFDSEEEEDVTTTDSIPHRTRLQQPELDLFNQPPSPPPEDCSPPPYSPQRGGHPIYCNFGTSR
jgi:hypothetical protein